MLQLLLHSASGCKLLIEPPLFPVPQLWTPLVRLPAPSPLRGSSAKIEDGLASGLYGTCDRDGSPSEHGCSFR